MDGIYQAYDPTASLFVFELYEIYTKFKYK